MGRFDALTQLGKKSVTSTPHVDTSLSVNQTFPSENHFASKSVNQQTSEETNQQASLTTNVQISKPASQQNNKLANQLTSKLLRKFGSYLTVESLKSLKRVAFESERKDYEVLQEAVDQYLERVKS